jgi:hypothetical protein
MPLRRKMEPKIVKNKVSNSIKDNVPTTGRRIQGSCKVGSFNDSEGNNPEKIKTSTIRITDPKNIKLPARLMVTENGIIV